MNCDRSAKLAVAWLVLLAGAARAQESNVKVSGRVVSREGKPIADADVAWFWGAGKEDVPDGETRTQAPFGGVKTDRDGRFVVKVNFSRRGAALLAIDSDQTQGGVAFLPAADSQRNVEIPLAPLVRVHGKFESKELGRPIPWTNVYISSLPGKIRLIGNSSPSAEFSLLLPPGEYSMNAYGTDVIGINKPLILRAGESDRDLGTLELPAAFLARHKGKELPPGRWLTPAASRKMCRWPTIAANGSWSTSGATGAGPASASSAT